jgi:hypothetical protein
MDDAFKDALSQINKPAAHELVTGFKEKMIFIKTRYKHSEKNVRSCLSGLSSEPTLLELLTAAFVVNGGILFKHGPTVDEEEEEEQELNQLIKEIENLSSNEDEAGVHHSPGGSG